MKTSEISNLRRDPRQSEFWRRAGVPRPLATSESLPFVEIPLPGNSGKALLLAAGRALYYAIPELGRHPLTAKRVYLGMLGGEPLEAETKGNVVKLHCRRSAPEYVTFTPTGEFYLWGTLPKLPPLSVRAVDAATETCDTASVKLSASTKNRTDSAIALNDLRLVTPSLLGSYESLKQKVKGMGRGMQPVLARYRLRDSFGATVHLSAPQLLCAPSGFQMTGAFRFTTTDSMASLSAGQVSCKSYLVSVGVPESLPEPWDSIVASAEIELSPQLDPVDPAALCDGYRNDSQAFLHYPGIPSVETARKASLRVFVAEALARSENLLKPVSQIGRPFAGASGEQAYVRVPADYVPCDSLVSIPETKAVTIGATYSARLTLDNLSLRASPARRLPPAPSAETIAAAVATSAGSWKAAVAVELSRGSFPETVVSETSASNGCPVSFGPLLVYPDAAATKLSVCLMRPDGSSCFRSFPLTPLPAAGLAYWLDPEIAPPALSPSDFGYEVPLESFSDNPAEDVVEIYLGGSDSPASTAAFNSEILAMADAPRARASWDFSRRRVLCFGRDGTTLLTIDSAGKLRSRTLVDPRPVLSPDAVAPASANDGAAILSIAGGDLLRIAGNRVETVLSRCGAERPGWCGAFNEIWLFGTGNSPQRLTADGEIIRAELPGISSDARCALWRGELLIGSGGALYNASDEQPLPVLPFRLSLDTSLNAIPKILTAPIFAEKIEASVTLSGHNGSEIFGKIDGFDISGQVNAPLRLYLKAPRRDSLRITAAGNASPDLCIKPFNLE